MRPLLRFMLVGALLGAIGLDVGAARANHTQPIGLKCTDFPTQADAQAFLREHPYDPDGMDGPPGPNNDTTGKKGVACEDQPCPCDTNPVTYEPGHDAPTVPTVVPIIPGSLQTDDPVSPGTTVAGGGISGVGSSATATSRGTALASPKPAGASRDSVRHRYAGPALAAVAFLLLGGYAFWLRRDRRREYYPTSRPRWPTEW
jgi:hypothetical protein